MAKPIIFDILAVDEASRTFTKVGMAAQGMGAKVESAGAIASRGFLYAGAAAAALGVHAIKMAGNFDAAITRLQTTAGESQAQLGMVSKGLLDMAGKVGYSAQELATGMYIVESAGYHGAAGLQVMEAAAKGARVEGANLGDTANAVSSLLVDYHLKASDAARVTNVLTAAVGHGKTTFQQMATALPNVAAAGASAKISMEEIASAIATMTMHGTDAAKAGTYLRQVIGQLEAPTAKARDVMHSLGIDANHLGLVLSSGSGHGLADAIKMVDDAITKHMTPSGLVALDQFKKSKDATTAYQKVLANLPPAYVTAFGALSNMVGGVKSLQGFLQLGGANLKTYRDNVAAVREQVSRGGKDVEGFAQQQQTLNGKLNDASGAASALAVSIGQKLTPVAKVVVGDFAGFVSILSKHQTAVTNVLEVTAALGGAMLVMKGVAWAAATATSFLGGEEGLLAIKMTAAAIATGDFAGAAAGASLAAGAMASTISLAAGAGGLGLLYASSKTTNNSLHALGDTAGGALLGFSLGGPIGAALGAGAGLIYGIASASQEAGNQIITTADATRHWVAALQGLSDVRSAQVRNEAANVLSKNEAQRPGTADAARFLGIQSRDLVSYITNEGNARKRLNSIIAEYLKYPYGSAQQKNAALTQLLVDSLKSEGTQLQGVIKTNREHNAAVQEWSQALKGVPKNVVTAIKLDNYNLTLRQVFDLQKKYNLTPGKVTTILQALGYDLTARQLDTIAAKANALNGAHPTVRVSADIRSALSAVDSLQNKITGLIGAQNNLVAPTPHPHHPAARHPAARVTGPSHGSTLGRVLPTVQAVSRTVSDALVPGFRDSGTHLSGVFVDSLATHIRSGKGRLSAGLNEINSLISAQTSKLQNLLSQRTSVVQGFMGMTSSVFSQTLGTNGTASVADLITYQQGELTKALQAQADVAKLVGEGLSKALVLQMANSGATGLANIHALAMGPASDVTLLNSLNAQTSAALSGAGMQAGNMLYGSQIQAATADQHTAIAIRNELEKWVRKQDKNTYVQLSIGGKTVQASLLELKRHNGNKPLGLA